MSGIVSLTLLSVSYASALLVSLHNPPCRGFICAQVAVFEELVEMGGDLNMLKMEKKIRQQGRKYVINHGDIISFDFYTPEQLAEQNRSVAGSSGAGK